MHSTNGNQSNQIMSVNGKCLKYAISLGRALQQSAIHITEGSIEEEKKARRTRVFLVCHAILS